MKVCYINLTNGIEAIPDLQGTDYNFLVNVALGNEVVVYGFGAGRLSAKQ